MNYEKAYKEALERAKYLKENADSVGALDVSAGFEYIFHELRESEDERIRKAILKMITDMDGGYPFEKYGIIKKDAIAWLEKQGEQKPAWSEEDELMIQDAIHWINEFQKSNRCKDENDMQNSVTCENWLKSIKGRVQPQPTSEWSKEDEEMYNEVLTDIIYTKNDMKTKGCLELSNRAMKAFNWFSKRHKSLKPQSTWKPSEEQMKHLKSISVGWHPSLDDCRILSSLYNDLKNL